ncbi:glycoside hydrolase family 78 protein [Paenibacillus koleovorans]|uniref:glycoside hydrolase family 78 protein n=1 Tax=Paenibacillus koleovorans TaxID=121608 RepID=UPI000FDC55C0|nr:DNRLRE domain-containing protein [Paenibacillus koleovorans]
MELKIQKLFVSLLVGTMLSTPFAQVLARDSIGPIPDGVSISTESVTSNTYEASKGDKSSKPPVVAEVRGLEKWKAMDSNIVSEVVSKRTDNSKHFLMNDGTYKAVISMDTLHYEDVEGVLQDIDTSLVDESEIEGINLIKHKISKQASNEIISKKQNRGKQPAFTEGNYKALQVPFDVTIPKRFADGYSIRFGEDKLEFTPQNVNNTNGSRYSSSAIIYSDAWKDTDVILDITNDGLKETILLKTSEAPTQFSYKLNVPVSEDFVLGQLTLLSPWLIDSLGEVRDVFQKLRIEGEQIFLDLTVDTSGLTFPITVDPTVTTSASADAWVSENGMYTNRGTTQNGWIGIDYDYGDYGDLYSYQNQMYYKFNLASVPISAIIDSATLSINGINGGLNGDWTIFAARTQSSWSETTITWWNKPGGGILDSTSFTNYNFSGWKNINVKNVVSQCRPLGAECSIVLSANPGSDDVWQVYTREAFQSVPQLVINYTIPNTAPTTPSVVEPNGGNVIDSNFSILWSASTDAETTQSNLKYQLQLSLDNGATWPYDLAPLLTTAGATSFSYNFSAIPATTNAIIRVRAYDGELYSSWDQSNAVFTIRHNQAPTAPTNLTPGHTSSSTPTLIAGVTPTVQWTFQDPDAGNTQSAYLVEVYDTSNVQKYTSTWVTSSSNSLSVPGSANLARNTTYYWRVKTKDNSGAESPYSSSMYFKTNALPTPTNIWGQDNTTRRDNLINFTWTYSDGNSQAQTHYQLVGSKDNWASWAYDSGEVASAAAFHNFIPPSTGLWSFAIRVKDGMEWSAWVYRSNITMNHAFEPNNTYETAFPISYQNTLTTVISAPNPNPDEDWYTYTPTSTGIDRVTMSVPAGLNYDVYVYDSSQNLLAAGVRGAGLTENVIFETLSATPHYIKVVGANGAFHADNTYSITLNKVDVLSQTSYQYDPNGNITNKSTTLSNSSNIAFTNPGFESGTSSWGISNGSGGTYATDTATKLSGTQSMKVTVAPSGDQHQYNGFNFNMDVSGRKFNVSAYVKTEGMTGGVSVRTYWKTSAGAWIWQNNVVSTTLQGTNGWTKLSATALAPAGAQQVFVMIVPITNGQGHYWIDNAQIQEIFN